MPATLILEPANTTLSQLERVYREDIVVMIDPEYRERVDRAAQQVARAAIGDAAVYGVNTGFGKLASTRIAAHDTAALQRNLIRSHCCGVGEPLSSNVVRLIIALKMISLGRGASGVRWCVIELLGELLRHDILPMVPGQGSVGASGDLAPLAHLTAALIGEGEVLYEGRRMTSERALALAGLEPIILGPKEGLGMINGTQVSTALALAGLFDAWRLTQSALVTGAMAVDALMASTAPFHPAIHELRGHQGQIDAARSLRELTSGSIIRDSHREQDTRVQDPYCLRCQPQVMGACIDLLRQAGRTLQTEANAVTDNPLVLGEDEGIVSGGNFHAEPVAFVADQCALAISEIGAITERRIATLVDPALNYGLPAFLSPAPGLNSGFMIAEVTAAALMAENKQRAMPCSVDSTPTSANQEDHVSMACHGARRLGDMNRNLAHIVAIELLAAAQGIDFRRPLTTSQPLATVLDGLRAHVAALDEDRIMAPDILSAVEMLMSGETITTSGVDLLPRLDN
jgi:histidine ammonia-lyase